MGTQDANKRKIENEKIIPVYKEMVESGNQVRFTISGNSMTPFVCHSRDSVIIGAPKGALKKGDIAFYQRDSGQYVLHRICKAKGNQIWCVGDAQTLIEGPLRTDQVFAVVTAAERGGKWIEPGSFWWWFFESVWIRMIPLRPAIMKAYGVVSKLKK